jgi:hypothetical protein
MGIIQKQSSSEAVNVRYSTLLGALFIASTENLEKIEAAKSGFSDAELKQGFAGDASKEIRRKLAGSGVPITGFDGKLAYLSLDEREVNGTKMNYVTVGLTDKTGLTTFFSSAIQNEITLNLINKLMNAEFGRYTVISCGAKVTDGKNEHAGKQFASHSAFIEQGGEGQPLVQLKGVNRSEVKLLQDTSLKVLREQNIDDKATLSKARQSVSVKWHTDLLKQCLKRYGEYQSSNPKSMAAQESYEQSHHAQPAYIGETEHSHIDMDDDVPF